MSDAQPLAVVAVLLAVLAGGDAATKARLSQWLYPAPPIVVATPQPVPVPVPEPPSPVVDPPVVTPDPPPPVETKPEPLPKPKAKPKREPEKKKSTWAKPRTGLPSCAVVKREYERMTYAQALGAYSRATPAQIAHGKRCLGM